MTRQTPITCPACESPLYISALKCPECETEIDGDFHIPRYENLNRDQLDFISI